MAFDPGFIDYRAEPNGGFTFLKQEPDGRTRELFFHGEDAKQMARYLDSTRGPDQRTAGLASSGWGLPSTDAKTKDTIEGFSDPVTQAMAKAAAKDPAPAPAEQPKPPSPPAPAAPQTPPPGEKAASGPQQGPLPGGAAPPQFVSSTGYPTGPNGDPLFPQPTEISLYKKTAARPGGYIPTTQGQTTEGAKQFTPGLIKGFEQLHEAEQNAVLESYKAKAAVFENQLAAAEAAKPELIAQELKARERMDELKWETDKARAKLDLLSEQALNPKYSAGPSVFGTGSAGDVVGGVGTLLAAALTSMGSAILGRGPTGFDVINQRLDRVAQVQRAEVQRRGVAANNALAQFQRQFGDLQTAELAFKAVQQQKLSMMAQEHAALAGTAEAKQAAMSLSLAADRKYLENRQALEEKIQGNVIQRQEAKYQAPSAGGIVRKTPQELKAEIDMLNAAGEYNDKARRGFAAQKPMAPRDERLEQQYNLSRRIRMDDGSFAYAPNDTIYQKALKVIPAAKDIDHYSKLMEDILNKPFSSWSPKQRGDYLTWSGEMKETAKTLKDLGAALTGPEMSMIDSYTNEGAIEKLANPLAVEESRAKLRAVRQVAERLKSRPMNELYSDPAAQNPIQKTEQQQGFTPGGVAATETK